MLNVVYSYNEAQVEQAVIFLVANNPSLLNTYLQEPERSDYNKCVECYRSCILQSIHDLSFSIASKCALVGKGDEHIPTWTLTGGYGVIASWHHDIDSNELRIQIRVYVDPNVGPPYTPPKEIKLYIE